MGVPTRGEVGLLRNIARRPAISHSDPNDQRGWFAHLVVHRSPSCGSVANLHLDTNVSGLTLAGVLPWTEAVPMTERCRSLMHYLKRKFLSRRVVCLVWSGHDYRTRFEDNWAFLECARCGSRTVGWRLDVAYYYRGAFAETFRLTFADDVEPKRPTFRPSPVSLRPLRLELDTESVQAVVDQSEL